MTAALDSFVLERAPGRLVELDPSLVRTREAFRPTLDALAAMTDRDFTYAWTWNGNPADIRYGFYRVLELLETATSSASRALSAQPNSEARDAAAAATASRWALQAILATLTDADLDADPGNAEWSVRRTMQHIVGSQRGYAWGTAAWLSLREQTRTEGLGRLNDEWFAAMPEEEDEARGSLADVRRKLDDIVDVTSARYATLTDDDMAVMGRWSGYPVSVAFRQWRWSSHIAEHTVQIEKTLDMLGRRRSEVDWLVRLIGRAFGALEATTFGRESAGDAASVFEGVARDLADLHPQLTAAAKAAIPAEDW